MSEPAETARVETARAGPVVVASTINPAALEQMERRMMGRLRAELAAERAAIVTPLGAGAGPNPTTLNPPASAGAGPSQPTAELNPAGAATSTSSTRVASGEWVEP